jgi:hypothetical protein
MYKASNVPPKELTLFKEDPVKTTNIFTRIRVSSVWMPIHKYIGMNN